MKLLNLSVLVYTIGLLVKPASEQLLANRAISFHEMSQYEDAIADYSAALQAAPQKPGLLYYNRAFSYTGLKHYRSAIADFSRAITIFKRKNNIAKLASSYNNRATLYSRLKLYNKALSDFDMAIKLGPEKILYYVNRAHLYCRLRKYRLALADYGQAIDLGAGYFALLYRGWIYKDLRKYNLAIADFTSASFERPKRIFGFLELVDCYQTVGNFQQARWAFMLALESHDPALAFAYFMRSLEYQSLDPATRPDRYDYFWPMLDKRFDFFWWEILHLDSMSPRYP